LHPSLFLQIENPFPGHDVHCLKGKKCDKKNGKQRILLPLSVSFSVAGAWISAGENCRDAGIARIYQTAFNLSQLKIMLQIQAGNE
jgi:hypothetical protein